jgi:hypothetical protein
MTVTYMTLFEASLDPDVGIENGAVSPWSADATLTMVEEEVVVRDEKGRIIGIITHEPLSIDCVFQ